MTRRFVLIAAVAAPFCLAAVASAADIQLANGDFEDPQLTPEGVPVGWHTDADTRGTGAVQPDLLHPHAGARAVRISDFDATRGYALQSRMYPAVPGESYTARAWVYNATGDGWLYLEFYLAPGTRVHEKHGGCGKVGSWEQIQVTEVCPASARYVCVLLYSAIHNVGQSAWDDVALQGPLGEGAVLNLDDMEEQTVDYSYLYNVGDRKQLLFDDVFLESHQGFWWRVRPPRKTGERNIVADKPWESFIISAWCTVMEDEGKYRMWYEAYDKGYTGDQDARYCYAESSDGIHWEKPALGLVEFAGSRDNNILFGPLEGMSVHGGTVFKDPTAPSEERYKFLFLSGDAVWGAHSADGIHWNLHEHGPILRVHSDTQTVAFWDERIAKYVSYFRLWNPWRTIGRAESADFYSFPEWTEVLRCDAQDPEDTDMYNSAAIKYPYAENAYFIFTSTYHHTADNLDVQLAVSRDGVHWSRPERKPFIPNGEPGSFDDATVYACVGLLRTGDELSMYYHGSRARHNQVYPQWLTAEGVISRAVLRLDGYVAMDAGIVPSEFVTHPLTFSGNRLELNAEVRPQGYVKVELQDAKGTPLPGFTLDECVPVLGDSVRHVVGWRGGSDVSALAGRPTKLHVEARDASLFAFQFL